MHRSVGHLRHAPYLMQYSFAPKLLSEDTTGLDCLFSYYIFPVEKVSQQKSRIETYLIPSDSIDVCEAYFPLVLTIAELISHMLNPDCVHITKQHFVKAVEIYSSGVQMRHIKLKGRVTN